MIRLEQLKRQNVGCINWKNNNFCGIINWCTSVGKSFYSTYKHPTDEVHGFIQEYLIHHPDNNILILLHDKINRDQWRKNLSFGFKDYLDNQIKLFTLDGIINMVEESPIDLEGGLLIIDEIHKLTTNIKRQLWDGTHIKFDHILGLTGTEELIDKYAKSLYKIAPIVDKITLEEANQLGFTANSDYTVIVQHLDGETKEQYKDYTAYIRQAINVNDGKLSKLYKYIPCLNGNWKNPDFDINRLGDIQKMLIIMGIINPKGKYGRGGAYCKTKSHPNGEWRSHEDFIKLLAVENGYTKSLDEHDPFDRTIIENYSPEALSTFAINLAKAWYERPKLIQTHEYKLEATYKLLKLFNFKRSIVFSESTKFVDDLHELINTRENEELAVKYHSKVKIPKLNADGTPKTMKRRKNLEKYAKGIENPKFGIDNKGRYLEVPVHIGIKDVMAYNKGVLDRLSGKTGTYIFAKAGDTGFNDESISLCIISSYSRSNTISRQREGRTLRLDPDSMGENKYIIYLAFEETYEMSKVTNLTEKLNNDNIYVDFTTLEGFMNKDESIDLTTANVDDFDVDDNSFDLSILNYG